MKIEEFDFHIQLGIQINKKQTNYIQFNMSCDWYTGEYSGIHCTTAASWRCYMKKYKDTHTTYKNVWHNDKEYLIYCFNKGWIKHSEIKKFVEANINMMEEVKLKHWAHRNRHHLRNIEKWWKVIMNKKYNSPTTFGIRTPSLIKKKLRNDGVLRRRNWRYGWVVNGRYEDGILRSIILRNGRSLKVYRKAEEEERKKQEEERKKQEEERKKQEEERKNRPRSYSSDRDDFYTGGMFSRCGAIHPWG